MAASKDSPLPTEIKLHQLSRTLEISFDDGKTFNLPCEFLRVYSPSAEVRGHGPGQETLQTGKRDVTITANAVMGEVKVIVDAGTHVVVDGVPIMGEFHQATDKVPAQLGPESPIVRVKGFALMASVNVRRLPPPGTPKKILGTY